MKRLFWVKEKDGDLFGQPPLYFRIYKEKRKWYMIIVEVWRKEGHQLRTIQIPSPQAGKKIAAMIWKDLVK